MWVGQSSRVIYHIVFIFSLYSMLWWCWIVEGETITPNNSFNYYQISPACCSGHGICTPNNICICDKNYYTANCSLFCNVTQCTAQPRRMCSDQGCVCIANYYGDECDVYCCDNTRCATKKSNETCSGNGFCRANGQCSCGTGAFWDVYDYRLPHCHAR